ncbi:hypothetical protein SAMN05421799_10519 [Alicyclobacillus vulcanalis]|uniref:Uncharacterized protein n=1 Tax=Alicyclobacillus vulcanalis TaxID=252246 RepID=A0A1N7MB72_9BACL|nr:hypothetical protein SAMN05421799_10519 [Alicyclobacillus vulcanalis]
MKHGIRHLERFAVGRDSTEILSGPLQTSLPPTTEKRAACMGPLESSSACMLLASAYSPKVTLRTCIHPHDSPSASDRPSRRADLSPARKIHSHFQRREAIVRIRSRHLWRIVSTDNVSRAGSCARRDPYMPNSSTSGSQAHNKAPLRGSGAFREWLALSTRLIRNAVCGRRGGPPNETRQGQNRERVRNHLQDVRRYAMALQHDAERS